MDGELQKLELDLEYQKLNSLEKREFQEGYASRDFKKTKSAVVSGLLKSIFSWEDWIKKVGTMEETMEKEKGTSAVPGTEPKEPEPQVIKDLAKVENGKKEMTLAETMTLGDVLFKSRYFDKVLSAHQAVAVILKGRELGIGPMTSLEKIFVVSGKTAIQSELMGDLIKRSGKYNYRILQLDNQICELEFFENGKSVGKSDFSIEDAKRAGVIEKDVWRKYPRNLLFARALSNGARWYCPDAIHSCYSYEEMNLSVDGAGMVIQQIEPISIEGEILEKKEKSTEEQPKTRKDELEKLQEKYGTKKLKEVKSELKLTGKLLELDNKEWKKFVDALTKNLL